MRNQVIALKYKADAVVAVCVPVHVFEVFCRLAVYNQVAAVVAVQAAYDIEHGRFARTAFAQHSRKFARPECDADLFERILRKFAGAIALCDVFQL